MIGKLTGIIDSQDAGGVIIDVSGVGYLGAVSGGTPVRPAVGAPASVGRGAQ